MISSSNISVPQIEEIIKQSLTNPSSIGSTSTFDDKNKIDANIYLDNLRVSAERWYVGLELFLNGQLEVTKFFGLSLIRDYMSQPSSDIVLDARRSVRSVVWEWISIVMKDRSVVPNYLVNNAAAIITLCVKIDYPEVWPTAFTELLQFSQYGVDGVDFVIRIFHELETEVVMFREERNKNEIAHNVIIKDTLRSTNTIDSILQFLCQWSDNLSNVLFGDSNEVNQTNSVDKNQFASLCERCLLCLSEFIGWTDINLIIQVALPTIYNLLQTHIQSMTTDPSTMSTSRVYPGIAVACCTCLFEIVKKGMEPLVKAQLAHSIQLLSVLTACIRAVTTTSHQSSPPSQRSTNTLSMHNQSTLNQEDVIQEGRINLFNQLGGVVDILLLELVGCWCKFEEFLIQQYSQRNDFQQGTPDNTSVESSNLVSAAPLLSTLLKETVPLALNIFNFNFGNDLQGSMTNYCNAQKATMIVLPGLNKLVSLIKQQMQFQQKIELFLNTNRIEWEYFIATNYLNELLMAIFKQLQYPDTFEFDENDEDEVEIMEMNKNVRWLYVNCCRICPDRCLELISAVMRDIQQPLSQAPFPILEAALRLIYAFSECGSRFNQLVNEGIFPSIILAINRSDIANHPNPQVVLTYFEISLRYVKHLNVEGMQRIVTTLVSNKGIKHSNEVVRNRMAYFIMKTTEVMGDRSYLLLSNFVSVALADLINSCFKSSGVTSQSIQGTAIANRSTFFSETASTQIFEALGHMCSSGFNPHDNSNNTNAISNDTTAINENVESRQQQQISILNEIVNIIVQKMESALNNFRNCVSLQLKAEIEIILEELVPTCVMGISAITSLARGRLHKYHQNSNFIFERTTLTICQTLQFLSQDIHPTQHSRFKSIRLKTIVYYHRMIPCMGPSILPYIGQVINVLLPFIDTSEMQELVLLINQCMSEFQHECCGLISDVFILMINKLAQLVHSFEVDHLQINGSSSKYGADLKLSHSFDSVSDSNEYPNGRDGIHAANLRPESTSSKNLFTLLDAPHLASERRLLQKHSLLFLQYIANTKTCPSVLYSNEYHSVYLKQILEGFFHLMKGIQQEILHGRLFNDDSVTIRVNDSSIPISCIFTSGIPFDVMNLSALSNQQIQQLAQHYTPLQKCVVSCINGLLSHWFPINNNHQSSTLNTEPSNEILAAFQSYLLNRFLPECLSLCRYITLKAPSNSNNHNVVLTTYPATSITVKHHFLNPAVQSLIVEIGALCWTLFHSNIIHSTELNRENITIDYFKSTLMQVGWRIDIIELFVAVVCSGKGLNQLGIFKEIFKDFIKSTSES